MEKAEFILCITMKIRSGRIVYIYLQNNNKHKEYNSQWMM